MEKKILSLLLFVISCTSASFAQQSILLNGKWKWGYKRNYQKEIILPGLITDPGRISADTIWLKRVFTLPEGNWTNASLELKGARFCPQVYVNGKKEFQAPGGMAPIRRLLKNPDLKPGRQVTLEIALTPLDKVPAGDASKIPAADLWRSNVSSCIWDDVVLYVHQNVAIKSIIPQSDFGRDQAIVNYSIDGMNSNNVRLYITILDTSGQALIHQAYPIDALKGQIKIDQKGKIRPWSAEHPNLYILRTELKRGRLLLDRSEQSYGFKEFKVKGLQFELNGSPVKLRAASVVWHRWARDPEAATLAWDTAWFERNIVQRLKDLGANTLRFHLGMPPDNIMKLCDRYGLMVQAEWSFFHGMRASENSLLEQWPDWFGASLRHPSTILLHGWNETEGEEELDLAFRSINKVEKNYYPVVIGHRDVTHVHKYWWSLFENLGLYYDSYKQFSQPLMVDEFGGNYLDGKANIGKYPTNEASFQRFLGWTQTAEERLNHQNLSNARVAEYWRRIGVAGFSPFCALSSPEDGNTWFMNDLKAGEPKPVWKSLAAAYSPRSVSIDLWDRHFLPGSNISFPSFLFNDTGEPSVFEVNLELTDDYTGKVFSSQTFSSSLDAYAIEEKMLSTTLPKVPGRWKLSLILKNPPVDVKYPVVSEWVIDTYKPASSQSLKNALVGLSSEEKELKQMLLDCDVPTTEIHDKKASLLVFSGDTWAASSKEKSFSKWIGQQLNSGKHIVLLDAGPQNLGEGYKPQISSLQRAPVVKANILSQIELPFGIKGFFKELSEPESNLQYAKNDSSLWKGLKKDHCWLWNGYRGGLIVPAVELELTGLNSSSFVERWKSRGAVAAKIVEGNYYAFELEGFYKYAADSNDTKVKDQLRKEVMFLVEDAPALKDRINPNAEIKVHNLSAGYRQSLQGKVKRLRPLAASGKKLVSTPVSLMEFGEKKGNLLVSQLLTQKRLLPDVSEGGRYGVKYDPVTVQFVLNMLSTVLENNTLKSWQSK